MPARKQINRKRVITSNQVQPTKLKEALGELKKHCYLFVANEDATWFFLFFPFLILTIILFKTHFAHQQMGILRIVKGREPSATAIFPIATTNKLEFSPAVQEVANGGFTWAEGPLWTLRPGHEGDTTFGRLLFSAVKSNSILKVEYDGMSRHIRKSGCRDSDAHREGLTPCNQLLEPGSNGLAYNPIDGFVYACEHGTRSVTRLEKNGTHTNIVRLHNGQRFNSPNDLIFTSKGDIFFTDPNYGLQGTNIKHEKEMMYQGLYFISRTNDNDMDDNTDEQVGIDYDSSASLLIDSLENPNGLALSPDESILYVINSKPPRVMKYNIIDMPKLRPTKNYGKSIKNSDGSSSGSLSSDSSSASGVRKRKERRKRSLDDLLKEEEEENEKEKKAIEKEHGAKSNRLHVENENGNDQKGGKGGKDDNNDSEKNKEKGKVDDGSKIAEQKRKPTLSKGEFFFDFQSLVDECKSKINQYNYPDGMKVDVNGNLYVAGACGVHVIGTDGKLIASLLLDKVVSNVAWGGDDRLYITASNSILRADVSHNVIPTFPGKMTGLSDDSGGRSWL
jgi:sugar lactone lactonase YvrE